MAGRRFGTMGTILVFALSMGSAWADTPWRPASPTRRTTPAIHLQPAGSTSTAIKSAEEPVSPRILQVEFPEEHTVFRPREDGSLLPVSGFGGTPASGEEQYNCGVITEGPPVGMGSSGPSFWDRLFGRQPGCGTPAPAGGHPWFNGGHPWFGTQPSSGPSWNPFASNASFRSDHEFDYFISPVTNPFYFEDPRSLTEFRPGVVWAPTANSSNLTYGGRALLFNFQGRLALTERWSLVIHRLGFINQQISDPPTGLPASPVEGGTSIMNIQIGPKFTFWRDVQTGTVAAIGANFDIPLGSTKTFQGGGGAITPYITGAQRLGDFNFMAASGYRFGFSRNDADFLFVSGHLDYNFANKFYPLVEVNWYRYTSSGTRYVSDFDGGDMYSTGANGMKGSNLLTVALGARYKFSEAFQVGAAYEIPVVGRDQFFRWRMTFDLIFRY